MTSLRPVIYATVALILVVSASMFSYIRLEDKSFIDALWLTMTSITTVGFGDVVPSTTAGRIITILLMLIGIGIFAYVVGTFFGEILEGHLSDAWGKRKMIKEISKLKEHIVVCGAGRVGRMVVRELIGEKKKFVVIEKDPACLAELRSEGDVLFIVGDATEDKVLLSAQVTNAKGVITTLADDGGNLMITIACKEFNPEAHIVARATRPESIIRLKRAGADTVVSPSAIAGKRMALASLKPASVAVVQTLIEDHEINLNLEELTVSEKSGLVGKELKNSRFREDYGVIVLAIRRGDRNIINPVPTEKFIAGDLLVLCGIAEQLSKLEKIVAGE